MYHVPVLLEASINGMEIRTDGVYVDTTFGGGGHSEEILNRLGVDGRLIAFDQDEETSRNALDNSRFTLVGANFRYLKRYLRLFGIEKVDGILADLGVSSHQFDVPQRGFSYRADGPLDMRMNPLRKLSAADLLNTYSEEDLIKVLSNYGEVRNSKTLAAELIGQRKFKPYDKVSDLLAVLDRFSFAKSNRYLAQVFQALRIEVNDEIKALEDLLEQSLEVLSPGGRLVVISYHSIEDRLVKRFMKTGNCAGDTIKDEYGHIERPFKVVTKKPIVPDDEEIKRNPRSRSAKLRIAEKQA